MPNIFLDTVYHKILTFASILRLFGKRQPFFEFCAKQEVQNNARNRTDADNDKARNPREEERTAAHIKCVRRKKVNANADNRNTKRLTNSDRGKYDGGSNSAARFSESVAHGKKRRKYLTQKEEYDKRDRKRIVYVAEEHHYKRKNIIQIVGDRCKQRRAQNAKSERKH